ncbi:hypothetical protein BJ508DRAFT_326886 [Ascobolus immersus RN42]|uniref:Uncharacterized protein n=1 Tax=Ascobolus immersus RN42 TaxID=1160509 RepID=A0A3N4IAA3_ASCIM|nr:hypothetical protein BJ508DRAFT_326886 [Ascobolus immersus RN42]
MDIVYIAYEEAGPPVPANLKNITVATDVTSDDIAFSNSLLKSKDLFKEPLTRLKSIRSGEFREATKYIKSAISHVHKVRQRARRSGWKKECFDVFVKSYVRGRDDRMTMKLVETYLVHYCTRGRINEWNPKKFTHDKKKERLMFLLLIKANSKKEKELKAAAAGEATKEVGQGVKAAPKEDQDDSDMMDGAMDVEDDGTVGRDPTVDGVVGLLEPPVNNLNCNLVVRGKENKKSESRSGNKDGGYMGELGGGKKIDIVVGLCRR